MWSFILNPFITVLTLLYSVTGNIVLSIVVFTVIVRMLTYPLTIQQQRSSRAMQELQPKLKKLQEKHKNDREKLAQEQMALYQEHGINPLGGCLPLVVQFPILIGLYQAIIYSLAATPLQLIDMSGRFLIPSLATEIPLNNLWLGIDLTAPPTANPIYAMALPALVVVTTWAQSKLTMPNINNNNKNDDKADAKGKKGKDAKGGGGNDAMDQQQAMMKSMTTVMPLMFGFFSLSFSTGLSIYFVVSNIIGAVQFGILNRNRDRQLALQAADAEATAEVETAKPATKKAKRKPKSAS